MSAEMVTTKLTDPNGNLVAAYEVPNYAMLILVGLHVLAALYHYFIRHDRVLQRMLPGV
jgi:cytochrome b561